MVVLTSFTQPTDGIRHRQNNTTVYVNDNNIGKGTLFIAESCLSWVSESGNGFSLEYPHISLHAVSRDLSAFPQECLFLMVDAALGDEETNNGNGDNDNGNESGSDEETTELRLVPDDRGMLDAMFHAMNVCQALHPDPEESFSDEDFYEDADDEIPMEEADYRMAGLRIESTDGRAHIGRGMAPMMDTEDRVMRAGEGILHTLGGCSVEGRTVGTSDIWGTTERVDSMQWDREVGSVWWSAVGNQGEAPLQRCRPAVVGNQGEAPLERSRETLVGGNQREVSLLRGRAGDTLGTLEGRTGNTLGTSEGRAGDTLGTSEGRVGDMTGGLLRGRVGDMPGGLLGGTPGDMPGGTPRGTLGTAGGMVRERVGGTVGTPELSSDMGRYDRSFSSGSIWHRSRSALSPAVNSPHKAPEDHHNFDDAEN